MVAFACVLVTLAGERPSFAGDNEAEVSRLRAKVWKRMLKELSGRGLNVYEPDVRRPEARAQLDQKPPTSLRAVRGQPSREARFRVTTWELKQQGKLQFRKPTPYTMKKIGQAEWGRPGTLQLGIFDRGTKEPVFRPHNSSRERKVGYRVDFQPQADFEIPAMGRGKRRPADHVSRQTQGTKMVVARSGERTYGGLRGGYTIREERGLLDGRPVARLARGGFVFAGTRQAVRITRATLEAKLQIGDEWLQLSLDAKLPIHGDPDTEWQEAELHQIMAAFAAACRSAVDSPTPMRVRRVRILDANPLYTGGRPVTELDSLQDVHERVQKERNAVAADGTTRVVLEIEVEKAGVIRLEAPGPEDASLDPGTVEMLFGGRAVAVESDAGKRHVAYALYTAPESFAEPRGRTLGHALSPKERRTGTRMVALKASAGPSLAKLQPSATPVKVPLVRPPVILVHGTFDGPTQCWETDARELEPSAGSESMATALRRAGYMVFKLDYRWTNGNVLPWGDPDSSSFDDNKRVLWENKQGLFEVLSVCRDELDIAVTQADVVGHSMGGVIPRLWASEGYNPDGRAQVVFDREKTSGYRRPDNFGQGDIHRLVTIGTTHMGSDFGHLGIALTEAPVSVRKALQSALIPGAQNNELGKKLIELFGAGGLGLRTGYGISEAVKNQRPLLEQLPNPALTKIGPTRVPAHAIVCAAGVGDLRTFRAHFKNKLRLVAWYMLNCRPEIVKAFFEVRGQAQDIDRIYGELINLDERRRENDQEAGLWLFDSRRERLAPKDEWTLASLARAILFGNTQNDMVVRVESQAGGLPLQYTTFRRGVLHSFATRYAHVQDAVVQALTGAQWRFAPEGFPAPHPMRNIERYRAKQDPAQRAAHVAASNIVPSHAESLSYVADKTDVVIIMRPVNEHATGLIQRGLATKDMHVKGKSASWGPQRGYIPVEQRFSKLHLLEGAKRAKDIEKFDGKVRECLASNRARETALRVSAQGTMYDVLVVEGDDLEPPRAIVLRSPDGVLKGWQQGEALDFDSTADLPAHPLGEAEIQRRGTRPFRVLADRHSGLALTADYDILAFGRKTETGPVQSHPEMGYVAPWQIELIRSMNNEVRLRGNYAGGNVSHHGPETQFVFSEGADYPNAAFEPDGDIIIIRKGPPGMKDLHLKRYFHVQRMLGYQLEPNRHTWNWGAYDPQRWPLTGWRPADDMLLITAKVLAEDNPFDSDEGDEPAAKAAQGGGR